MEAIAEFERSRAEFIREFGAARQRGAAVALGKSTSNLFRRRESRNKVKLDVRRFGRVLGIDTERMIADSGGMTTYESLVEQTLKHGLLPAVVPQLKTITIGGAVSGVGIESSSFRFGLVHETVEEMEIVLGDGRAIVCSRRENQDLFFGFPNSYGTLGYALRVRVRLIPAKAFVKLTHARFMDAESCFSHIATVAQSPGMDYLDGTIFGRDEMYVTTGEFVDDGPYTSDYTYTDIYYRSIQQRRSDYLRVEDYIWRWDTDWFWCSKQFGVQRPVLRFFLTPWALNSRMYQRIMRLSHKLMPATQGTESVIQDVDIPIDRAAEFLDFLLVEIGITPIWACPIRSSDATVTWDLYALDPGKLYINFGFWDVLRTKHEEGHYNRLVERRATELGGKKGLYSTAYYDQGTFRAIYNGERYDALKEKYDPGHVFRDLYEKCVERPSRSLRC